MWTSPTKNELEFNFKLSNIYPVLGKYKINYDGFYLRWKIPSDMLNNLVTQFLDLLMFCVDECLVMLDGWDLQGNIGRRQTSKAHIYFPLYCTVFIFFHINYNILSLQWKSPVSYKCSRFFPTSSSAHTETSITCHFYSNPLLLWYNSKRAIVMPLKYPILHIMI